MFFKLFSSAKYEDRASPYFQMIPGQETSWGKPLLYSSLCNLRRFWIGTKPRHCVQFGTIHKSAITAQRKKLTPIGQIPYW